MNKIYLASILIINSLVLFSQQTKEIIFSDSFDSYTAGEPLYTQNPDDWYLQTIFPGPTSPYISNAIAHSNPNSVFFDLTWENIIKPLDNFDTGFFSIQFNLFFQQNKSGMFHTLSYFDEQDIEYAMQVSFEPYGQSTIQAGSDELIDFVIYNNTWIRNKIIIDLDNDWASYILNDEIIHEWAWSLGQLGNGGLKMIGGSSFSGLSLGGGDPGFYVDDYKVTYFEYPSCLDPPQNIDYYFENDEIVTIIWDAPECPGLLYYNVYDNGNYDVTTGDTLTWWAVNFGIHVICVKAIYETGISECASVTIVITGEEEKTLDPFSIFPNPATNEVNIQSEIKIIEINVFDLYGVKHEVSKKINNSESHLNTSQLKPGIYLLQFDTETGIFYRRIIKK